MYKCLKETSTVKSLLANLTSAAIWWRPALYSSISCRTRIRPWKMESIKIMGRGKLALNSFVRPFSDSLSHMSLKHDVPMQGREIVGLTFGQHCWFQNIVPFWSENVTFGLPNEPLSGKKYDVCWLKVCLCFDQRVNRQKDEVTLSCGAFLQRETHTSCITAESLFLHQVGVWLSMVGMIFTFFHRRLTTIKACSRHQGRHISGGKDEASECRRQEERWTYQCRSAQAAHSQEI